MSDIRLRLQPHHDAISVGGVVYPVDADHCVSVPEEQLAECLRHGAVPAPEATEAPAKKRSKKDETA